MDNGSLLNLIIELSKEAGKSILNIYNTIDDLDIKYKDDNSPLTRADEISNEIICKTLKLITPNIPILSEEGKKINYNERKKWNKFWLIDPLDGTKEFVKRNGEFTVNIALIDKNTPTMGVVHAPVINTTWYGSIDNGSFKTHNKTTKSISVICNTNKKPIKVVSSRSHANNPKLDKYLSKFDNYKLVAMGSSIKICLVADGSAHLYPRFGPTMEWDTAAAHAVVKYAGGNISDFNTDKELLYNKVSLLNPEFLVGYRGTHA